MTYTKATTKRFFSPAKWKWLPQFLAVTVDGTLYKLRFFHTGYTEKADSSRPRAPYLHRHDMYHVVLYRSGSGTIRVGQSTVRIGPDILVLTGPPQAHDFHPRVTAPFSYREVSFQYESSTGTRLTLPFDELFSLLTGRAVTAPAGGHRLREDVAARLSRVLERFATVAGSRGENDHFSAGRVLAEVLGLLLDTVLETRSPAGLSCEDPAADLIRQHIEAHCGTALNLQDLAAEAGLSARQLQRRFKASTGMTVFEYRNHRRMQIAGHMLREQGMPIKEVAYDLGFSSPYHFSREFKNRMGLPPSEYRQSRVPAEE